MKLGGMLDDKKSEVYSLVDSKYLAKTVLISAQSDLLAEMRSSGLDFPVIIKPDIGFKGFLVRKIDNERELQSIQSLFEDRVMLMQEYLSMKREFSIMCYKRKNSHRFAVSSFVEKKLPFIMGDGTSSIKELIEKLKNPFLKKDLVLQKLDQRKEEILEEGIELTVDHVGNYARGSKFYNMNNEIDSDLIEEVNNFFQNIEGLNFGRLDIKAESIDQVKRGEFKLLEINGAKAEPIHIYDINMSVWSVVKDVHFHWTTLFKIVKENLGIIKKPTTREGLRSFISLKKTVSS